MFIIITSSLKISGLKKQRKLNNSSNKSKYLNLMMRCCLTKNIKKYWGRNDLINIQIFFIIIDFTFVFVTN
jgi:hypothetical protein